MDSSRMRSVRRSNAYRRHRDEVCLMTQRSSVVQTQEYTRDAYVMAGERRCAVQVPKEINSRQEGSDNTCISTAVFFFFSSRRRHTRFKCDWSSDVCSSDLHSVNPTMPDIVGNC